MSTVDRRGRAAELVGWLGAELLLAANPASVMWLTGYVAEVETGPSPFAVPPLVLLEPPDQATLILAAEEAGAAERLGVAAAAYHVHGAGPLVAVAAATRVLQELVGGRVVAIEAEALPLALAEGVTWRAADGPLARLRAVKDPDEIALLRAAIAAADAGHRALRQLVRAGTTEIELFSNVHAAMETHVGARVPVLADLVGGPRAAAGGGSPSGRALRAGELVLCDLAPRVAGYWGDSCATIAVGPMGALPRRQHSRVQEALRRAIDAARPGIRADQLDALTRAGLDYPHHTGHGIGTSYHEAPRIVPSDRTRLESGMVVALEPACYEGNLGVRLEQVVLITASGCEVLSRHELQL